MDILQAQLDKLIAKLEHGADVRQSLKGLESVYPFNEFEYVIAHLLSDGVMALSEYRRLRQEFTARNPFLHLFELSGSAFSARAVRLVIESAPSLKKASKRLDPYLSRKQYDLFLPPDMRIEVKAARAVSSDVEAPLFVKALSTTSKKPFDMIFEQIKPEYCDVFLWVAVWRDDIRYWVLPSRDVQRNRYYQRIQHPGAEGEGQLHLKPGNIHDFDSYLVPPRDIGKAIRAASARQRRKQRK